MPQTVRCSLSLKYLLPGPLHKKFADTCSRLKYLSKTNALWAKRLQKSDPPLSSVDPGQDLFVRFTKGCFLTEIICSQQKMRGNYGDFPYTSLPTPRQAQLSPVSISFTRMVHFLIFSVPILAYHHHPKSIVYPGVHCWCCTFFGFEKCVITLSIIIVSSTGFSLP